MAGRTADVARFRRLAHVRPDSIFKPEMLVGESTDLFSERAISYGRGRSKKKYCFQARDEDVDYFKDLSLHYPTLGFVLVFGWDGPSYGSHYISQGRARSYAVSRRLAENTMSKYGVEEGPDGEWPYEEERQAEDELMNLAEAHWEEPLRKGLRERSLRSIKRPVRVRRRPLIVKPDHYVAGVSRDVFLKGGGVIERILNLECGHKHPTQEAAQECLRSRRWKKLGGVFPVDGQGHCLEETLSS